MDNPSSVHLLSSEIYKLENIESGGETSYVCTLGSVCTLMDLLEYFINENSRLKSDVQELREYVADQGARIARLEEAFK